MKLSTGTIDALGNFSAINPSIFIPAGNIIRCMDAAATIGGKINIAETFDHDVAIYDLPNFLQVMKLFSNPDIISNEKQATIKFNNGMAVKYLFASKNAIHKIIDKDVQMPEHQLEFDLPENILKDIIKSSGVLSAPHLVITRGDSGNIKLITTNVENPSSNTSELEIPTIMDELSDNYQIVFHIENISKIMARDYKVKISNKRLSEFSSGDGNVIYWLAMSNQTVIE